MDKGDYEQLVMRELSDIRKFALVHDPEPLLPQLVHRFKAIINLWHRALPPNVARYLESWANAFHTFPLPYCLPKLHKMPEIDRAHLGVLKGRLILPSHS
jgi:hypothetical protein